MLIRNIILACLTVVMQITVARGDTAASNSASSWACEPWVMTPLPAPPKVLEHSFSVKQGEAIKVAGEIVESGSTSRNTKSAALMVNFRDRNGKAVHIDTLPWSKWLNGYYVYLSGSDKSEAFVFTILVPKEAVEAQICISRLSKEKGVSLRNFSYFVGAAKHSSLFVVFLFGIAIFLIVYLCYSKILCNNIEIFLQNRPLSIVFLLFLTVVALTAYFTSIMYFCSANSLCGPDSELCMWLSMGHEAWNNLPNCGLIRLNLSRGIVQWVINVIFVAVAGISVCKAMALTAAFNALTIVGLSSLLSIHQDKDRRVVFSIIKYTMLVILQSAFYRVNVGHEVSYVLVVLGLFVVAWRFSRSWERYVLVAIITVLGVINDDMFLICFVAPVVSLNILRFILNQRIDKVAFSVVFGMVVGSLVLRILIMMDVFWYRTSPIKIVRAHDLSAWFNDMFMSYLYMFRVVTKMGCELKLLDVVQFFAVSAILCLSVVAFIVACYRCCALKLSRKAGQQAYVVFAIVFITISYLLIDTSTKQLGTPVPRYVYFAVMALLYLLVDRLQRNDPS